MSPEMLKQNYNEKCDNWACGVIMHIMLCGSPPFKGRNEREIKDKIKGGSKF